MSDLTGGKGIAHGVCVVTDKEDDKAFLVWNGTIDPDTGFNGEYEWTGGTEIMVSLVPCLSGIGAQAS